MAKIKNVVSKVTKAAEKAVKTAKKIEKVSQRTAKIAGAVGKFAAAPSPMSAISLFETIKGKGDYEISHNTIMSGAVIGGGMQMPRFAASQRTIRIRHTEYIGDVISSSTSNAFSNTSYIINPGSVSTFPWLSKIAQNYDQWKPHGIVFGFKSTSAAFNGTTQALGSVVMATDYDVLDSPYTTKVEMENSEFAVSCSSDSSMLHPVECDPAERLFTAYTVRTTLNLPSNATPLNYDLGNFQVATVGITGTSVNLGELWVTYDIEFMKQQYNPQAGVLYFSATGVPSTYLPSSSFVATNISSASTFLMTCNGNTIYFPSYLTSQSFLVTFSWKGTTAAAFTPPTYGYFNCTLGPLVYGSAPPAGSASWSVPSTGENATLVEANMTITITGPSASISIFGGTLPSSLTGVSVTVAQITR